ncbi:MAG TPA: SigE family RNA polymerase sigma factor [Nocardioides sp.]|nr:SigE family RNA polymerase sigma factor [Nocardioides sp.]
MARPTDGTDSRDGGDRDQRSSGWSADEALELLYAAHWRRLVRLAVLLVHDQGAAEEIVQDCFVAVHARWGRLHDPDRGLAYLRQSVVNRSRSHLRHLAVVRRHAEREVLPDPVAGADHSAHDAARRETVLDALRRLPRRQREVLALRYYLDLSEAEIAETLGISRGAVKSHASRGAAALRAELGAMVEETR